MGPSRHRRRGGSALVLTLATLGVLVLVAVALAREARAEAAAARATLERRRLAAVAADAVRRAMARLADDEDLLVDHPDEPWARPETLRAPDGVLIRVRVADEQARFDLNNLAVEPPSAPRLPAADILADLLLLCGDPGPRDRIGALSDWVDADNDGPAEAPAYAELRPPRAPPNRPLLDLDELRWIAGFSGAWIVDPSLGAVPPGERASPRDLLAVLPGPRRRVTPVNLNTAPEPLLLALLGRGQRHVAHYVVTLREAAPIRSLESLAALADPIRLTRLLPWLDVRSEWFQVEAEAVGPRQAVTVQALVHRAPDGVVRVVRWES